MPLSTVFHLYRGSQFSWWTKPEYPEKTTILSQVTDKLSHYYILSTIRPFTNILYIFFHNLTTGHTNSPSFQQLKIGFRIRRIHKNFLHSFLVFSRLTTGRTNSPSLWQLKISVIFRISKITSISYILFNLFTSLTISRTNSPSLRQLKIYEQINKLTRISYILFNFFPV